MANIGLPNISIVFKGLGTSVVQRGSRGIAVLIIKDDTSNFDFVEYSSIADLTSAEEAKYTATNLQYIKDALTGTPAKLVVARMDTTGTLADLLALIKGKKFDWIGIAEGATADQDALVSWVKSTNISDKKRYKCIVYNATNCDDMHVVNLTNTNVKWKDSRGEVTGEKFVARLLGFLAGMPLTMSAIAKTLNDLVSVTEPVDLEDAVNAGEFVLFNDEGEVRVARAINSLVTTGEGITDDMKFILIVETMDLIYNDILKTWKSFYQGKYKNNLDNQMLLIGAINSYFKTLQTENILDDEFDNKAFIDVEAQRQANISKYGELEVASWSDDKVISMTVGTNIFLNSNIKILNAMEDFKMVLSM